MLAGTDPRVGPDLGRHTGPPPQDVILLICIIKNELGAVCVGFEMGPSWPQSSGGIRGPTLNHTINNMQQFGDIYRFLYNHIHT